MAIALVLLAVGAVLAGYVGVPAALGGGNRIERFLEQSFEVPDPAQAESAGPAAEDSIVAPGENPARILSESTASRQEEGHGAPDASHGVALERALMGASSAVALIGIGLAFFFFQQRPERSDRAAARFPGLHRLLLNKYFVDEFYVAVVVNPIRWISDVVLWRGVDAGLIDGAVNGTGQTIDGASSVLRRLQTGSLRAYAAWVIVGAIFVLGFYLWRWQA